VDLEPDGQDGLSASLISFITSVDKGLRPLVNSLPPLTPQPSGNGDFHRPTTSAGTRSNLRFGSELVVEVFYHLSDVEGPEANAVRVVPMFKRNVALHSFVPFSLFANAKGAKTDHIRLDFSFPFLLSVCIAASVPKRTSRNPSSPV
jgi:hypothetical protein